MYQGSHLPNFEALGVPNSKRQTRTHTQTDGRTTPHRPIVKDFFETFTKMSLNVNFVPEAQVRCSDALGQRPLQRLYIGAEQVYGGEKCRRLFE